MRCIVLFERWIAVVESQSVSQVERDDTGLI